MIGGVAPGGGGGGPGRQARAASLGVCLLLAAANPALAQNADRDLSIENLPRPGYEPRDIVLGSVVIQARLDAEAAYNDNIFAAPSNRIDDVVFDLRPSLNVRRTGPLDLRLDLHSDLIRYASFPRENVDTFGARLDASRTIGRRNTVSGNVAFDRTFERRSDPEARVDPSRPPALINVTDGELRYNYQGSRFEVAVRAGATKVDYLAAIDDDRDLTTYRGTLRLSLRVSGDTAVFVEPFVSRRQFRLPGARGGFGDSTVGGAIGGVSFTIGQRLNGGVGVGVFRANPDGAFASYTGVEANGHIVWRPRIRTAVTFDVFRGDVATVRQGAAGRIDTSFGLGVDQEVRHNLLLHAGARYRAIKYRGGIDSNQRYASGDVAVRYLFNRYLSAVVGTEYRLRRADQPQERFDRFVTSLGIRLVY